MCLIKTIIIVVTTNHQSVINDKPSIINKLPINYQSRTMFVHRDTCLRCSATHVLLPTEVKTHSNTEKVVRNCIRSPCSRSGLVTNRARLSNGKSSPFGRMCPVECGFAVAPVCAASKWIHQKRTFLAQDVCEAKRNRIPIAGQLLLLADETCDNVFVKGTTNDFAHRGSYLWCAGRLSCQRVPEALLRLRVAKSSREMR